MNRYIKIKHNEGFTLVELLVALTIMAIMIASFALLAANTFAGTSSAGLRSKALYDAQKQMEQKIVIGTTEDTPLEITFSGVGTINVNGKLETVSVTYDNGKNLSLSTFVVKK